MTSPYKAIAQVRDLTGFCIRLDVFEEIVSVDISDTDIKVVIHRFKTIEQRSQYRIKAEGLEQLVWAFDGTNWLRKMGRTLWTEVADEVYLRRDTCNTFKDIAEYRDHRNWELDCHRPGNARTPLDNAQASDSERMLKHWKLA